MRTGFLLLTAAILMPSLWVIAAERRVAIPVTVHGDCPNFRGQRGVCSSEQRPTGRENGTVPLACERLPPPYRVDKGGVVLTFDDRNFDDWLKAMPLFDQYGVSATFFISGAIDRQAIDAARQLKDHGQAIGCHGVHHLKAVEYSQQQSADDYVRNEIRPQMDVWKTAGITPTAFAYPNSRNDAATDSAILKILRHVRTGGAVAPGEQISGKDVFFVPADKIGGRGCLCGKGIDDAPNAADRTYEQLDAALARAAKNKEIIVLYAHNIASSGKGHHVSREALEHVFRKAKELELNFYSFDQLP